MKLALLCGGVGGVAGGIAGAITGAAAGATLGTITLPVIGTVSYAFILATCVVQQQVICQAILPAIISVGYWKVI